MPKVHEIGNKWFIQFTNFPFKWGTKLTVKGWTQEIQEPYRTAEPLIFRLPRYKAVAVGKWSGQKDEETALNEALQRRDLTEDDFQEEKGWRPPDQD
jgi:hypothetical protein